MFRPLRGTNSGGAGAGGKKFLRRGQKVSVEPGRKKYFFHKTIRPNERGRYQDTTSLTRVSNTATHTKTPRPRPRSAETLETFSAERAEGIPAKIRLKSSPEYRKTAEHRKFGKFGKIKKSIKKSENIHRQRRRIRIRIRIRININININIHPSTYTPSTHQHIKICNP